MSSQPIREERTYSSEQTEGTLQPFEGFVCPGLAFESGHTIWLFKFSETPTPVGEYSEIWLEAPDGELTLYADPEDAGAYVSAYHDFDLVEGATLDWLVTGSDELELMMDAADGTTLQLRTSLEHTVSTRIMEGLAWLIPDGILRTGVGGAISNFTFNLLMEPNGTKLLGQTETSTNYWVDADALRTVDRAVATLNETDLGRQVPSSSPRTYGDVRTAREPYVFFGALHLEYPAPGQPLSPTDSPHSG